MKCEKFILLLTSFLGTTPLSLSADEIMLRNGDRLTGQTIRVTTSSVFFKHEVFGTIEFKKKDISGEKPAHKSPQKGDLIWGRTAALGYELSTEGNNDTQLLNADFFINRNRMWVDEWSLKGAVTQETTGGNNSAQKAEGSVRYAYSIKRRLYHFFRFAIQHDLFENIKVRLVPSSGLGFWLFDSKRMKSVLETGFGYRFKTFFKGSDEKEAILHVRGSFSKKILNHAEIGTNLFYFPELDRLNNYRMETEGFLKVHISKHTALKLKFQDQFRSDPPTNVKRNVSRLTSGIELNF